VVEVSNLLLLLRFLILDFRIVPTIWYFLFNKNAYTLQLDTLINIRFQYIVEIPFREAKKIDLYDNTSIITSIPRNISYWTAYYRHEYLYWLNDTDDPVIHQGIYIYIYLVRTIKQYSSDQQMLYVYPVQSFFE
jgi:hypothetical protein